MANFQDVLFHGILAFCAYMSYRGAKKIVNANERMRKFDEEYRKLVEQGNYTINDLDKLSRKYNVVTSSASFKDPKTEARKLEDKF